MKVVVAGGGIAGNSFVGALLRRRDLSINNCNSNNNNNNNNNNVDVNLRIYEATDAQEGPPGVNILLNHNGLYALRTMYPTLYESLLALPTTSNMVNWSARTVDGQILYHLPNVTTTDHNHNLAQCPALVAQWNQVYQATRKPVEAYTTFSTKVTKVAVQEHNGILKVQLQDTNTNTTRWETDIDLLVATDGRYSAIRQQLAPSSPTDYGPPCVIDYRIIIEPPSKDDDDDDDHDNNATPAPTCPLVQQVFLENHLSPTLPMWRVYHKPNATQLVQDFGNSPGVQAAADGYTRVGLMRLGPNSLGLYGNIALPKTDASVDPIIQEPAFMAALLTSPTADALGQLTKELVLKYGHTAYWARKQQTDTCYTALNNRVLFIGDSAGGIYPSLGQGANLSLEDAVVAATAFPNVAQIDTLRHDRREFIKSLSQYHARHLCEDAAQFHTEMTQWRGEDDHQEWHGQLRRLWSPFLLALRAVTATQENWAPFGQLIGEAVDGVLFDSTTTDADLDLSQGIPRMYYMKLQGGRPLRVSEITRHKAVTQCLGALSTTDDFYLVVHRPDKPLSLEGLHAFRIPPRHFVKLHRGTWHVGPLWTGSDRDRTFCNLELADTNLVDHETVTFRALWDGTSNNSHREDKAEERPLTIPVMPVRY